MNREELTARLQSLHQQKQQADTVLNQVANQAQALLGQINETTYWIKLLAEREREAEKLKADEAAKADRAAKTKKKKKATKKTETTSETTSEPTALAA